MTTSFESIATLSEQELLDHFQGLVVRDRRTTAELLVAIAEIDERKLWAGHACSSMFTFCMERFHMSEQVTAKRLWAARTARRFPVVLEMVARGELHLAAIHLLAKHLTPENHARVLERARHKSSREVERLVAELAPQADVPSSIRPMRGARGESAAGYGPTDGATASDEASMTDTVATTDEAPTSGHQAFGNRMRPAPADREVIAGAWDRRPCETAQPPAATKPIVPLSPRRHKIEITVDEATHDKLRSLQDLLACSETGRDPAAILSRAIDVLLVRTLTRKAACTDRPTSTAPKNARCGDRPGRATPATVSAASQRGRRTRTIAAAVRREVWRRDCGRCCYVDGRGRRCSETSKVEFHHRTPFARGGQSTPENIELRCAAHNQYQADLDFGGSFMNARRGRVAAA